MFLYTYLVEIKNRFFLVFTCWASVFVVCYFHKETILYILVKLIIQKKQLSAFYFISTELTDVFRMYMDISNFVSVQLIIIFILYQALMFLSPGLFLYEYKKIKFMLFNSFIFALLNIFIFNLYVLPYFWNFFLSYTCESCYKVNLYFESKLTEYISFYKRFYYSVIFFSQGFVLFSFFVKNSENRIVFVTQTRKLFYLSFILVATTLTPPDVFSQLVVLGFFVLIFEILILSIVLQVCKEYYK